MKKTYQVTEDGLNELKSELEELKASRGEIAEKIAAARDFGDLSENAEYDTAREQQGLVESRIAEIDDIILNAEIIKTGSKNKVHLGSKITLELDGKEFHYTVVGPVEADPMEGKISDESPIGEAVMGKKLGDTVTVKTPKGEIDYTLSKLA